MKEAEAPQPTTTFILLRSHEPTNCPTITDAGSQAGQAFNQVLRYIAGCPGFQTQLFGWPWRPDPEDVNVNEWMASITPGLLGLFINWNDERSARNFLLQSSLSQAFQGLTTFFETPSAMSTSTPAFDQPMAINITWSHGNIVKTLNRTKLPLRIAIGQATEAADEHMGEDMSWATGTNVGQSSMDTETCLRLDHISSDLKSVNGRPSSDGAITFSLMRTRYCSRLKEDLYDMIRARRAD
ncbi:uncharacterized protein HMPREF1541_06774 [Cyphellophora europaea CBS 101466]|uniref:Uncharacterized protein n=1 Tax=Cyphellophora europaea (strain CBS 101466) TaxID=1220924 RepID=W2RQC9_CYPE1|nr:uncharacterized protein HMPREF1541_06774 [Cyphellophora europaea CBS 101466]ETN38736.1 hypothetical protein HMPREF1541_06774 [Cyphellophora europaea CBS 101466]